MFKSRYDGPAVTLKRIEESGAQIERRAGEGFSALLKPLDNALQGTIGWIEKLDEGHKGLADAVLLVTGSMAGLGAALAAIGFLAPAITSGAGLLGGALLPAAGAATLLGIPAAVGYSIYRDWGNGTNYSDPSFQPEFGIPLMNQDDWDSRHPPTPHEAGHMVRSPRQSGIGSHWDWQPANSGATNGTLEINIHTDPGTQAEVKNAPEGVMINQRTDPGQTLGRP
jgi:hypothetical protein